MGRRAKRNLDYVPLDVGLLEDNRITGLLKKKDSRSMTVYIAILCAIYKNGYYLEWDEDTLDLLSGRIHIDNDYIEEVVQYCVDAGLFDKTIFKKESVLTSKEIQTRYLSETKIHKRISAIDEYDLIGKEPSKTVTDKPKSKKVKPKPETPRPVEEEKPKQEKVEEPKPAEPVAPDPQPQPEPVTRPFDPSSVIPTNVDTEVDQMKHEQGWIDGLQVIYNMRSDKIIGYLEEFRKHCKANGCEYHYNISEAKRHFNNWIRILLDNERRERQRQQEQDRRRADYDRRRGVILRPNEKKDYSDSF